MRPPDLSRTPSLPRFALGKILLLVEDGAFAGVNQAIRKHTQGRYGAWRATGASMTPTYNPELTITGRFYGIRRERFAPSEVKRGMMVSSRSPMDDDRWLGKRIIGIPGDIVRTRSDWVHNRYVKVPPGYRWIEGDGGKARSIDSNQFGPVPIEDVRAILHFMIYPFAYWGKLQWQLKGQEILKDRIVTDPAQIKALEKKGGLEFVMSWKVEQSIIKTHAKKVEVTAEGDQKAVALRGQAIGFLQKASVRCLQEKGVKAAKARAKVATTNNSSSSNSKKKKKKNSPEYLSSYPLP
ncbi:mitochondrial carrier [Apiospora arundinis]